MGLSVLPILANQWNGQKLHFNVKKQEISLVLELKSRLNLQKEHNLLSLGRGAKYQEKESAAECLSLKMLGRFCTAGHEPQIKQDFVKQVQKNRQWSTAYYLKENHLSSLISFLLICLRLLLARPEHRVLIFQILRLTRV